MATTTEKPSSSSEPISAGFSTDLPRARRSDAIVGLIIRCMIAVALVGGGIFFGPSLYRQVFGTTANGDAPAASTHRVTRGTLLISVTEDGNLESASNKDLKCQIEGGSSILWIVEDGKEVKKDEELVHLDRSFVEDKLNSQKIVYGNALTAKIQAEKDVLVAEKSIEEYELGTFKKEQQDAKALIKIAMENLRTSENLLQFTTKMVRKGFATSLQLEADEFAVQRAQLELESANTAKEVLEKYSRSKMLIDLQSQLATAKARLNSEQAALELEKARMDRLEGQLTLCILKAPQDGMVVYANSSGRRSTPVVIEEGSSVHERQTILRLPDLSQMQVKVNVHESRVDQIEAGLLAKIMIQGKELNGEVFSVANQPEPTSFFSGNVKAYPTIVKIDGVQQDLKPGMTAEVTIYVAKLDDVLAVPVQCFVETGGKFFAWVQKPDGPQRREVVLGRTNDKLVEVTDGLNEGDDVLLNPRSLVPEASEQVSNTDRAAEVDAESEKYGSRLKNRSPKEGSAKKKTGSAGGGQGRKKAGQAGGGGFANLDTDKDGKLSPAEVDAGTNGRMPFDGIDKNKDGFIEKAEFDARPRAGGGGSRPPGGGGAGAGRPGPADGPAGRR